MKHKPHSARKFASIFPLLLLLGSTLLVFVVLPSSLVVHSVPSVSTVTAAGATTGSAGFYGFSYHSLYSQGRYWVFYYGATSGNSGTIYVKSSANGATWSAPSSVFTTSWNVSSGVGLPVFNVYLTGANTVYYAWTQEVYAQNGPISIGQKTIHVAGTNGFISGMDVIMASTGERNTISTVNVGNTLTMTNGFTHVYSNHATNVLQQDFYRFNSGTLHPDGSITWTGETLQKLANFQGLVQSLFVDSGANLWMGESVALDSSLVFHTTVYKNGGQAFDVSGTPALNQIIGFTQFRNGHIAAVLADNNNSYSAMITTNGGSTWSSFFSTAGSSYDATTGSQAVPLNNSLYISANNGNNLYLLKFDGQTHTWTETLEHTSLVVHSALTTAGAPNITLWYSHGSGLSGQTVYKMTSSNYGGSFSSPVGVFTGENATSDLQGGFNGNFAIWDNFDFSAHGGYLRFGTLGPPYRNTLSGSILNLDCGNCLLARGKFYQFFGNITNTDGANGVGVDVAKFNFSDGVHSIVFGFDNTTGRTVLYSGGDFITLGVATTSTTIHGKYESFFLTVPIALRPTILDRAGITIYMQEKAADGTTSLWTVMRTGVDIVNQGGATSTLLHGNASHISGEGPYAYKVGLSGWAASNTTWIGLQHYQTEFAISLHNNINLSTANDPFLWQDPSHSPGCFLIPHCEIYTVPGDWNTTITWIYYNNASKQWTFLEKVVLSLKVGDQGASDQWSSLNVQWFEPLYFYAFPPGKYSFSNWVSVKNDTVTVWIEQAANAAANPGAISGQIRLFVDLWLDSVNGSTVHGGRVGAYYTGMSSSGYAWWVSWSPTFGNQTESVYRAANTGPMTINGLASFGAVPDQSMLCSKIEWNVTRTQTPGWMYDSLADKYFTISTHAFSIERFVTSPDIARAGGIDTPQFTAAQVPNLPQGGFLTPLFALLATLASAIWGAISSGLGQVWASLGSQFPWFTSFWNDIYTGILAFSSFFFAIFPDVVNGVTWAAGFFQFFIYPVTILQNSWTWFTQLFSWLPVAQAPVMIEIIVIWVFSMSVVNALYRGDYRQLFEWARIAWRIAREIMYYTYLFATEVINQIVGLIP